LVKNYLYLYRADKGKTERKTNIKTCIIQNVFSKGEQSVLRGKQYVLERKRILKGKNMFLKVNSVF